MCNTVRKKKIKQVRFNVYFVIKEIFLHHCISVISKCITLRMIKFFFNAFWSWYLKSKIINLTSDAWVKSLSTSLQYLTDKHSVAIIYWCIESDCNAIELFSSSFFNNAQDDYKDCCFDQENNELNKVEHLQ